MGLWRNWAGNQQCLPVAVEHPESVDDLVALVKRAESEDRRVKVVGAGHSFTDIACTTGYQVVLDRYRKLLAVDTERRRVTVQAGIPISDLNHQLHSFGYALPNLGDIAYQSIAGAVSTATHGTGAKLGGIATQIVGLEIVAADGSVITCSADEEPDIFSAARVSLGALGIVSTVTLECCPAFNLRAVEEPMRVDTVLENLDELVDGNDHFEFFWVPHSGWALTKRNNRTTDPAGGRTRWTNFRDKVLLENVAFGVVCRVGRRKPEWIPRLAKAVPSSGRSEYVERSFEIFASPRWVRFYEMEYAVPRQHLPEALNRVRQMIDDRGLLISFPVEVRFVAGDDIPLSTANGRDTGYIAVHVFQGMQYDNYFRAVEEIMNDYGGRPHWGKLHFQTATELAGRYPQWDEFQSVRRRLDPAGRFTNAYLDRVLGPTAAD